MCCWKLCPLSLSLSTAEWFAGPHPSSWNQKCSQQHGWMRTTFWCCALMIAWLFSPIISTGLWQKQECEQGPLTSATSSSVHQDSIILIWLIRIEACQNGVSLKKRIEAWNCWGWSSGSGVIAWHLQSLGCHPQHLIKGNTWYDGTGL